MDRVKMTMGTEISVDNACFYDCIRCSGLALVIPNHPSIRYSLTTLRVYVINAYRRQ